jgi:hypothetical protein
MRLNLQYVQSAVNRSWKSMHSVCAFRKCRNTMLMRSVPNSRSGVRVGDHWYCSVECFAEAACVEFSAFQDRRVIEMPHNPRISIGLVLLSKGHLENHQLRFAVEESQQRGEDLELTLIRLGLATERQIAAARAAQWGCPVFGPEGGREPIESDIPVQLLRTCWAVPLRYSQNGKRLLMGFVFRVEHRLLLALEQVTGCKTEPCFITQTEFEEQMARLTMVPDCNAVMHEEIQTPRQMADTVARLAIEARARKAVFAECRDFLWTRLVSSRRTVDVLFRTPNRCN